MTGIGVQALAGPDSETEIELEMVVSVANASRRESIVDTATEALVEGTALFADAPHRSSFLEPHTVRVAGAVLFSGAPPA